jgi:hypothetical protein
MRISEVRPGMKGYGLTVFVGTKIEKFDVEVIGISRNMNPQQDVVLIRTSGQNLEHTGSVAGMSGSPIFLTDDQGRSHMIGAYAYGWPLSKDPIAGVQPIEYMLQINPARNPSSTASAAVRPSATPPATTATWTAAAWQQQTRNLLAPASLPAQAEGLTRLATPIMASGVPAGVVELLAPLFTRNHSLLLQSGTASGPADAAAFPDINTAPNMAPVPFAPGGAMVVPVMTGDVNFTALGTITEVLGDRIFGFGHPMFSEGSVELPLAGGYVNMIVARITNSFKMGGMTSLAGTLHADEQSGVAGLLGKSPDMIPIEVNLVYADGSLARTYHFQAIRHRELTAAMGGAALMVSAASVKQLPPDAILSHDIELTFAGDRKVKVSNLAPGDQQVLLMLDAMGPIVASMNNPFERIDLQKMTATVRVTPGAKPSELRRVVADKALYRPGETVNLDVILRQYHGGERLVQVAVPLPKTLPDGTHTITVADAESYLSSEMTRRPDLFTATNATDVLKIVELTSVPQRDHLFATLALPGTGVSLGRVGLQHIPASKRMLILRQPRSDTGQTSYATTTQTPAGGFVRGSMDVTVNVKR